MTKGSYSDHVAGNYTPKTSITTTHEVLSFMETKNDSAEDYVSRNSSIYTYLPIVVLAHSVRKAVQSKNTAKVIHPALRVLLSPTLISPLILVGLAYDFFSTAATCHLGGMDNVTTATLLASRATQQAISSFAVPLTAFKIALKATKNPFAAAGIAAASGVATSHMIADTCDRLAIKGRFRLNFLNINALGDDRYPLAEHMCVKSNPATDDSYLSTFPNLMLAEASPESEVPREVGRMMMMSRYESHNMNTPQINEETGDLYNYANSQTADITGIPVPPTDRLFSGQSGDHEEYSVANPALIAMDEMLGFTVPKDTSAASQQMMIKNVADIMKTLGY